VLRAGYCLVNDVAVAQIPGSGLAKGLAVTLRTMTRRSITRQYPDVPPDLPPRSRGVIALFEENCTVCMLCARECPDWCIYIDSHKEVIPAREPGARDRTRNVLDRFAIDFALCMYCGICVEACPFDALFWSPEFEYAEYDIRDLTHERDRLREWMWTVPPPPPLDPRAEAPKEVATARAAVRPGAAQPGVRAARTERAERPERPERPQRAERPEPAERAERPQRGEQAEPPQRAERAERVERVEPAKRAPRAARPRKAAPAQRPEKTDAGPPPQPPQRPAPPEDAS
jgi:NADH-quinone oxidoreductase subunit I